MTTRKIAFWASAGLLAYTHAGYGLALAGLARRRGQGPRRPAPAEPPTVSVIVAAYAEQEVIADRVANLRALRLSA